MGPLRLITIRCLSLLMLVLSAAAPLKAQMIQDNSQSPAGTRQNEMQNVIGPAPENRFRQDVEIIGDMIQLQRETLRPKTFERDYGTLAGIVEQLRKLYDEDRLPEGSDEITDRLHALVYLYTQNNKIMEADRDPRLAPEIPQSLKMADSAVANIIKESGWRVVEDAKHGPRVHYDGPSLMRALAPALKSLMAGALRQALPRSDLEMLNRLNAMLDVIESSKGLDSSITIDAESRNMIGWFDQNKDKIRSMARKFEKIEDHTIREVGAQLTMLYKLMIGIKEYKNYGDGFSTRNLKLY